MTNEPANIILEHLKVIQANQTELRDAVRELREGQITIRNDVHSLRGDILRQDRNWASFELRLGRIETTLGIEGALPEH